MISPRLAFILSISLVFAMASTGCSLIDGLAGDGDELIIEPQPEPFPEPLPEPVPPPGSTCSQSQIFTQLLVDDATGAKDTVYDGDARILEVDRNATSGQLVIDLSNNGTLSFQYDLGIGTLPLNRDQTLHATVRIQSGMLPDVVLSLNETAADGTAGALIAAMWDTSTDAILVDIESKAGSPRYMGASCMPVDDGCGERGQIDLEVRFPGEPPTLVQPGVQVSGTSGFRATNSVSSFEYVTPVQCPDVPGRRMVGNVIRD